jgi:DNA uptake protein ComE-like DNA-binding protein
MIRTRIARVPTLAARAAALLVVVSVAACQAGSKDAARSDSTATLGTAAGTSAPTTGVQPENRPVVTGDSAGAAGAPAAASAGLLDPNSATREQLTAVPGMTVAAADALIAGRPYQSMVAVDQALAKHLGADARKTVYAHVFKPIDLNTAAGPEILLIPGVGARMRHEFEEYRPYKSIEQFRREIGKYVDKAEVARLEQYVTVK